MLKLLHYFIKWQHKIKSSSIYIFRSCIVYLKSGSASTFHFVQPLDKILNGFNTPFFSVHAILLCCSLFHRCCRAQQGASAGRLTDTAVLLQSFIVHSHRTFRFFLLVYGCQVQLLILIFYFYLNLRHASYFTTGARNSPSCFCGRLAQVKLRLSKRTEFYTFLHCEDFFFLHNW